MSAEDDILKTLDRSVATGSPEEIAQNLTEALSKDREATLKVLFQRLCCMPFVEDAQHEPEATLRRCCLAVLEVLVRLCDCRALFYLGLRTSTESRFTPGCQACSEAMTTLELREAAFSQVEDFVEHSDESTLDVHWKFVAQLVQKFAELGHVDSCWLVARFYQIGEGVARDEAEARKWFNKARVGLAFRADDSLQKLADTFDSLDRLTSGGRPMAEAAKSFYQHQADLARRARQGLHALLPGDELAAIVGGGEGEMCEFKSELTEKRVDEQLVKTVAAFLNASGGTLVIGVTDEGQALGLENTLENLKCDNKDELHLLIVNKLRDNLRPLNPQDVSIDFPVLHQIPICKITVRPSRDPVYRRISPQVDVVDVRFGNSSKTLAASETQTYIARHWPAASNLFN